MARIRRGRYGCTPRARLSSIGRANATPTPCKKLRRSIEWKFIQRMLLIISPERL